MASWIGLYDTFLGDVPGCSVKTACDALRDAAQVFCERTLAWRMALDPVPSVAQQAVYDFGLDPEQKIVRVLAATLDGADLPLRVAPRRGEACACVLSPRQFELHPVPLADGAGIVFKAALAPSSASSGMDDGITDQYGRALAAGAKARLFALANQPFTNPASAATCQQEFDREISNAISDVARAYSSAPLRVRAQLM